MMTGYVEKQKKKNIEKNILFKCKNACAYTHRQTMVKQLHNH